MKRVFLGSVALIALGLGTPAAFAADMRVAPAPVAPPAYSWSGCYIGGGWWLLKWAVHPIHHCWH